MSGHKLLIYLKQKRYVFGLMRAKYWAEAESGIVNAREGFRSIHIYEAELWCRKPVLGFDSVHTDGEIRFSNQDKLRKKFNAITLSDADGVDHDAIHIRDVADVEELAKSNPGEEKNSEAFGQYIRDYNNWPVRPLKTSFVTSFPPLIKTTVRSAEGAEQYELRFEEAKLYNFTISKVQDEGAESSGTIEGTFIGYVEDRVPREIDVEDEPVLPPVREREYPYLTGKKELKTVDRIRYTRYEFCEAPGAYTWSGWNNTGRVQGPGIAYTFGEAVSWLVVFVIFLSLLVYAWPVLLAIAGIGIITWLFSLRWTGKLLNFTGKVIGRTVSAAGTLLLVGGILAVLTNAGLFGRKHSNSVNAPEEGQQQEEITDNDTIISQYREWSDYHGNTYSGYLRTRLVDYRQSKYFRTSYPVVENESGYSRMCRSLVTTDSSHMNMIYDFFDSLRIARSLNRDQFAEAILTCIQDIPYYLITPGPCDYAAYPENDFAHNYLLGGGACEGYETNGILSPVEFAATMKGDCDTRTVFAYTVLKHFGFNVGVYGSDYYSHSVLGIELENRPGYPVMTKAVNDVTYCMCELTTYGPKPGQLPDEVSDMTKWKLELN